MGYHFPVAVFTNENLEVDTLLNPFNKFLKVRKHLKYTREELISLSKDDLKDHIIDIKYDVFLRNPDGYMKENKYGHDLDYLKSHIPQQLNWTDDEHYRFSLKMQNYVEIGKDGEIYSTDNPRGEFDYYTVGGIWSNYIKLRDKKTSISRITDIESWEERCNSAKVKDIDFSHGKDKFLTSAVVDPSGKWYDAFNICITMDLTYEERLKNWENQYANRFIEKANPEWLLTIVDCGWRLRDINFRH